MTFSFLFLYFERMCALRVESLNKNFPLLANTLDVGGIVTHREKRYKVVPMQ